MSLGFSESSLRPRRGPAERRPTLSSLASVEYGEILICDNCGLSHDRHNDDGCEFTLREKDRGLGYTLGEMSGIDGGNYDQYTKKQPDEVSRFLGDMHRDRRGRLVLVMQSEEKKLITPSIGDPIEDRKKLNRKKLKGMYVCRECQRVLGIDIGNGYDKLCRDEDEISLIKFNIGHDSGCKNNETNHLGGMVMIPVDLIRNYQPPQPLAIDTAYTPEQPLRHPKSGVSNDLHTPMTSQPLRTHRSFPKSSTKRPRFGGQDYAAGEVQHGKED